jgi:hypothetical protein
MHPSEPLTVERVAVATRADAALLSTSQLDEHKIPIADDVLDAAVAALLDGTDRGVLLLASWQESSVGSVDALTFTWSLEHGSVVVVPSPERGRGLLRQTHPGTAQGRRGQHHSGRRKQVQGERRRWSMRRWLRYKTKRRRSL